MYHKICMLLAALLLAAIGGDLLDSLGRSLLGWLEMGESCLMKSMKQFCEMRWVGPVTDCII
jgi:hypothetical protein